MEAYFFNTKTKCNLKPLKNVLHQIVIKKLLCQSMESSETSHI